MSNRSVIDSHKSIRQPLMTLMISIIIYVLIIIATYPTKRRLPNVQSICNMHTSHRVVTPGYHKIYRTDSGL